MHDRLGDGELPLRGAESLIGIPGGQCHLQGPGLGHSHILAGEAHETPHHVQRILPTVQHPRQPVQGGVRIAHRLVEGRDEVVVLLAGLVVQGRSRGDDGGQILGVQKSPAVRGGVGPGCPGSVAGLPGGVGPVGPGAVFGPVREVGPGWQVGLGVRE